MITGIFFLILSAFIKFASEIGTLIPVSMFIDPKTCFAEFCYAWDICETRLSVLLPVSMFMDLKHALFIYNDCMGVYRWQAWYPTSVPKTQRVSLGLLLLSMQETRQDSALTVYSVFMRLRCKQCSSSRGLCK